MNMFSKIKYMKIFIPKINESWIVDRFRSEWYENNRNSLLAFQSRYYLDYGALMWKKFKFFLKRKKLYVHTTILLSLNLAN